MILASSTLTGKLTGPDQFILVGYFVLMLGIGVYFFRYMKGMKDYFSGGNDIPWWLSGVSFFMSSFSAFAFISYSALAYKYGWVSVTLFWVTVPATIVNVLFFAKKWRRARIDSPVEFLEARYGPAVRQLFAWQGIPVKIIDDGLKLIAIGTFIAVALGMDIRWCMLGAGLIILVYTFMGGLWAVTVTDFVQFVVMSAAIAIILPLSLMEAGGLSGFFDNAPKGFFTLITGEYSWLYIAANIFMFTLGYGVNWTLIQRYYCVPKERDALKVGWLVVVLNVIGPPLMFVPAMAARHFLPDITDGKEVYPLLCIYLLPAGMLGLVIASMFSATASMLSSDYNVCANVLTNDVYRRLINQKASQRELVWVGRIITLVIGLISIAAAFVMVGGSGEDLFRNMVKLFSIATAPVAVPMLLGLLSSRMTNAGALVGFLGGIAVGLVVFFVAPDQGELGSMIWKKENLLVLATATTTTLLMVGVSLLLPAGAMEGKRAAAFLARLTVPIGQMDEDVRSVPVDGKGVISPFRVVGISTFLIGLLMLVVAPWVEGRLALGMDLGIAVALMAVGGLMTYYSWRPRASQESSV